MSERDRKIFQEMAEVIFNKRLLPQHYLMRIGSKDIPKYALPGQFVNIRASDKTNPLLRRPFSFHRINNDSFDILYKLIGKGTEILSDKKQGEKLDIIGPLGNGFNYELLVTSYSLLILVAGGIGVAPLLFLAKKIMERKAPARRTGRQSAKRKAIAIIGAKTKAEILCLKQLKELGFDVRIATEDGSAGKKALATDLLRTMDYLPRAKSRGGVSTIYACGPNAMLKEVARIAKKNKIKAQVLLEEHMACGIGACLGCAIKIKNQSFDKLRIDGERSRTIKNNFDYKLVCKDGPVFNADEIVWD